MNQRIITKPEQEEILAMRGEKIPGPTAASATTVNQQSQIALYIPFPAAATVRICQVPTPMDGTPATTLCLPPGKLVLFGGVRWREHTHTQSTLYPPTTFSVLGLSSHHARK